MTDFSEKLKAEAKTGQPGGIKALASGKRDMFTVNPYDLHIKEGWNFRDLTDQDEADSLSDLAKSIAANGVKTPLKIYLNDNKLFITDGHRRHTATLMAIENLGAEIVSIPAIMGLRGESEADRKLEQFTSNTGRPPSPLQTAGIFKDLLNMGWSEESIAVQTGLTVVRVQRLLDLLALPEQIKAAVARKEVSPGMAAKIVAEEPTVAKAVERVAKAVEVAQESGATRAMPKHDVKARVSLVEKLRILTEFVVWARNEITETEDFPARHDILDQADRALRDAEIDVPNTNA